MPTFTSPAVVKAIPTRDPATGLPIAPAYVAEALQAHLNELLAYGYGVLGVLTIPDAVLCTAVHPRWGVCAPLDEEEEAVRAEQQAADFEVLLADV